MRRIVAGFFYRQTALAAAGSRVGDGNMLAARSQVRKKNGKQTWNKLSLIYMYVILV